MGNEEWPEDDLIHLSKSQYEALEVIDPLTADSELSENADWSIGVVDLLNSQGFRIRNYVIFDDEAEPCFKIEGEGSGGDRGFESQHCPHDKIEIAFDCDFDGRLVA